MTGEGVPKRKYSPEEDDAIIDKCLSAADPHASKETQEQAVKRCLIDEMLTRRRDSPEFIEVSTPISKSTVQGRSAEQYERETADALCVVSQAVEALSKAAPPAKTREPGRRSAYAKVQDDGETAAALREVGRALRELSKLERNVPARGSAEVSAADLRQGLHCLEQAQKALSEASYLKFLDACTADLPPSTLAALGFTNEVAVELVITKVAFKRAQRVLVLAARQKFREYCFSVLSPAMRETLGFTPITANPPSGPTGKAPVLSNPSEATEVELIEDASAQFRPLARGAGKGEVQRTYSTSLTIPQALKADLRERFKGDDRLYYRALGVYKRVFAEGVKQWCRQIDSFLGCPRTAQRFTDVLADPERYDRYTSLRERGYTEKYHDSAYLVLFNTIQGMVTLNEKRAQWVALLEQSENQYAVAAYLLTGQTPYSFKRKVAEAWGTSPGWVRNTTVGWRRKLDRLPAFQTVFPYFQLEAVTAQTAALHDEVKRLLARTPLWGKAAKQVLHILQKERLVHLLLLDLPVFTAGVLNQKMQPIAEQLHIYLCTQLSTASRQALIRTAYTHAMTLTPTEFTAAAHELVSSLDRALAARWEDPASPLQRLKQKAGTVTDPKEKATLQDEVRTEERKYNRFKTFRNACALLEQQGAQFAGLLQVILPASRFQRALAAMMAQILRKNVGGRKRRLLGPVATVLSRACLQKYAGKPADVVATLQPWLSAQTLLTPPFCAAKRRKKLRALELPYAHAEQAFPPLYVEHSTLLRAQLDLDKPVKDRRSPAEIVRTVRPALKFILPREQTKAAWEKIRAQQVSVPATHGERPRVPPELATKTAFTRYFTQKLGMEARLTKKMVAILQHGAQFSPPRVLPPRGPSQKVIANLVFHGIVDVVFETPPEWYTMSYARKKGIAPATTGAVAVRPPPVQSGKVIGLDLNRITVPDLLTFATTTQRVPSDRPMAQVHLLRQALPRLRARLKVVSQALAKGGAPQKAKRLLAERTLLYRRKQHLKQALDVECGLAGARVLLEQGAGALAAEGLDLETRGLKGAQLAIIVTDMPKRLAIPQQMAAKANHYHRAVLNWTAPAATPGANGPVALEVVSAWGTSQYCAQCGKKLKGITADTMECPAHGRLNRHANAAQRIAQRGEKRVVNRAVHGIP